MVSQSSIKASGASLVALCFLQVISAQMPPSQLPTLGSEAPAEQLPTLPQTSPATAPSSPLSTPAIGIQGAQLSGYAQGLPKPPFPLGAATAAYQVEGAAFSDGRGPSIWDTFAAEPGKILNGDTGTVADDFYDRFAGDIATAQAIGVKMFRMSISWSRVLPNGTGQVNQVGMDFYNNVVDTLLAAGIEPHVTLFHWDLPQALEDAYSGWLSPQSITDFASYAATMFTALGDRVKHWTTFNEMQTFIQEGYSDGSFAPGRCSDRSICAAGDSSTEPYIVLKNVLLAHGQAAAQLRSIAPGAMISSNFNVQWAIPLTSSASDQAAVQQYLDFTLGIYADPLFFGNFPASVQAANFPGLTLSTDEQAMLAGSVDYFALNHYTTNYVTTGDDPATGNTVAVTSQNGIPIGAQAQSNWLYVTPQGMQPLLQYIDSHYKNPIIYITENGCDVPGESQMELQESLNDTFRINYYQGYIQGAIAAVQQDGVNVAGYFAWSLLDNFEWLSGYDYRFGIIHVDYTGGLVRYAKESAMFLAAWFSGAPLQGSSTVSSSSIG